MATARASFSNASESKTMKFALCVAGGLVPAAFTYLTGYGVLEWQFWAICMPFAIAFGGACGLIAARCA
jgi:hypothetical protein